METVKEKKQWSARTRCRSAQASLLNEICGGRRVESRGRLKGCTCHKGEEQSNNEKPVARNVSSNGTWLKAAERGIERDRKHQGQCSQYERSQDRAGENSAGCKHYMQS